MEDWDLWIRLAEAGAVFRKTDAPMVRYRKHSGAACADGEKYKQREDALRRKHGSNPMMLMELIKRLRETEKELEKVTEAYRGMVSGYQRSLSSRIRKHLKSILRRK